MDNYLLNCNIKERDAFVLNYNYETNVTIVKHGTDTEPPFSESRFKVWKPDQLEPSKYDVKVDRNGFIKKGKYIHFYSISTASRWFDLVFLALGWLF